MSRDDDYLKLDLPEGLSPCPCCGSQVEMWQYVEKPGGPAQKVVMCSNGEPFGPQDSLVNAGCPLYMPPMAHYYPTIREAAKYWNEYAKALMAIQRKNRWERHQVTRSST